MNGVREIMKKFELGNWAPRYNLENFRSNTDSGAAHIIMPYNNGTSPPKNHKTHR
jgi:hypothetical protein